jgi:hypothetical protein
MSEREIKTVVAWVDGGAPPGDPGETPPMPARAASGWKFDDPPDIVIPLPTEFHIPASGLLPFIDRYVPVPWTDGLRFVQRAEVRTHNTIVAHHIQVNVVDLPPNVSIVDGEAFTVDTSGGKTLAQGMRISSSNIVPELRDAFTGHPLDRLETRGFERIVTYTPGRGFNRYADGVGVPVRTGQYINFNLHYTVSGRPEVDRPELALWFVKGPVKQLLYIGDVNDHPVVNGKPIVAERVSSDDIERGAARGTLPPIPPYMADYTVDTDMKVTEDITIWAFVPHMHKRGKVARFSVTYPDGRQQLLMEVPHYRYDWQERYELAEPLKVPKGSVIKFHSVFDNSLANRNNPGADRQVYWSWQTWDEMNVGQFDYTVDRQDLRAVVKVAR